MRISDWSSEVCSSDLQHHGEVAAVDGGGDLRAQARPGERRLGEHRHTDDGAEVDADQGDHGEHGVAEPVAKHDLALPQALGPGRAHVVGSHHLEHRSTGHAGRQGRGDAGQRERREYQVAELLDAARYERSEEHTSELQSLMRISYAVFCLKKKKKKKNMKKTKK